MHDMLLLPKQGVLIQSDQQLHAARGGVRSGKSLTFANWMHDRLELYPKGQHYVVGADLPQLKRGFLRTFRIMLIKYGISHSYTGDGTFTLHHNGAKLEALSAEVQDRIRSSEFDSVLLEEPPTWRDGEEVYDIIITRMSGSAAGHLYHPGLEPRLRMSFNPRMTPPGHWLWNLLEERKAMPCEQLSVRDNYLMPDYEKYIALLESQLPQHLWASELDGDYATGGGAVYRYYKKEWHDGPPPTLPPFEYADDRELLLTFDFNVAHMTCEIAQAHVQNVKVVGYEAPAPDPYEAQVSKPIFEQEVAGFQHRLFYFLDEVRDPGGKQDAGSPELIAEVIARWGDRMRRHGVTIYGDASGGSRSQTSSAQQSVRSNYGIIIESLERHHIPWRWKVPSTNPGIGDRVNATCLQMWRQSDLGDSGIGLFARYDRNPSLVRDWQSVKWDPNGYHQLDKKTDLSLTHASDAADYMLWVEYQIELGFEPTWLELRDLMNR